MEADRLYRWWGAVALMASLLAGGCNDGASRAIPARDEVALESRMLFCEAPVGDEETSPRWSSSPTARVTSFVTAGGDAGVEIVTQAGGTVRADPRHRPDYANASRALIHLSVQTATPQHPVRLEVSFFDDLRQSRYWRTISISDNAWHTVEIELPFLRYDRGRIPRWENVNAWGMTFRDPARVKIRSLELWQDGDAGSATLGSAELRELFDDPSVVRQFRRSGFTVMTDAPALEGELVLDALVDMRARMQGRFTQLPAQESDVPLLVFATDAAYRRFWKRVSARTGSRAFPLPQDDGYTWLGIATASFSHAYGPVRPLYVHEASHALVERTLGVDAHRSWLFEGLANIDQFAVSGQDAPLLYRRGLTRPGVKSPVFEMLSGEPIPTTRYWQATLLVQYLLADPQRARQLDETLSDMRRVGSTDLRPWLRDRFGADVPRFSANFWNWAWRTYADRGGPSGSLDRGN